MRYLGCRRLMPNRRMATKNRTMSSGSPIRPGMCCGIKSPVTQSPDDSNYPITRSPTHPIRPSPYSIAQGFGMYNCSNNRTA